MWFLFWLLFVVWCFIVCWLCLFGEMGYLYKLVLWVLWIVLIVWVCRWIWWIVWLLMVLMWWVSCMWLWRCWWLLCWWVWYVESCNGWGFMMFLFLFWDCWVCLWVVVGLIEMVIVWSWFGIVVVVGMGWCWLLFV